MESLHAASTDQEWQARPRPRSGPIIRSARGVDSSSGSSAVTPPVGAGEVEEGQGAEDNAPDSNSATGDNDDDAASAGGIEEGGGETGTKASAAGWRRGRGGARDQWMVKKAVHLNQLAVYWNPTDVGNACSLHLSDIPVEQAEAVFSRCGPGAAASGREAERACMFLKKKDKRDIRAFLSFQLFWPNPRSCFLQKVREDGQGDEDRRGRGQCVCVLCC